MAVTEPISLSKVITEFGAPNPPLQTTLATYTRGIGFVANHENNSTISSSIGGIALSQFLNADKDFDTLYGTNGGYWTSGGIDSWDGTRYETASGFATPQVLNVMVGGGGAPGGATFQLIGGTFGSQNNFNYVGTSKSSLITSNIRAAFDWQTGNDPFQNYVDAFTFALDNNMTSFAWTSVIITIQDPILGPQESTFTRSSAAGVGGSTGAYTGAGSNVTYWTWFTPAGFPMNIYGTPTSTTFTANFRIQLVL